MSDNIKVVVKVRPLISREIEEKLSYQWRVRDNTLYQIDQNGKDLGQSFTFDKVYDKDTKTSDVYNDIAKPIVQAATAGFNGTIFAYGQTSSGKTYTMTGTESSPGIIPLAVLNLFEIIKSIPDRDFLVRVSYIEIYNETVKDLLNIEKSNIKVHETLQGIKVDASEKVTSSPEEVLEIMKEGEANRQMGATNMNEQSSRSHSIFQITIESREHTEGDNSGGCVNVSQLNLVDLAGSERAGQTGATGIRFKEGTHINKSLSALALVIKQLSEDPNKYANYRDSKLTRILQNSLGGNAKTSIICAVTPAAVEETISTLQFANRAKAIKNKPEVNAVATDATMIQRLTKQMSQLKAQLESKKNLEQDNYNLQKQITALQRLILNGFAQRRSIDLIQGSRRKLQPPRRVTIHSTVSTIEDEPVVNVPKFCTPSLKYNPLSIPTPMEFAPVVSSNKLASVPEEPPRLVTPPPQPPPRKSVYFNDEVIELDSDDDSVHGDHETCSPIHKCYGSSKTPPCILRKNAKMAEKNLRDIVELTEREKIYAPSTVELMEKLERNSTVIAKLQDEIEFLNKQGKEKDLELDVLKSKIKKNEDELKALCSAKAHLQTQCENYTTKLTDWEVSYETLRNKAKLREEELLSLLEEIKVKKPEEIGKIFSRTLEKDIHFMDMSKDISLVNSDIENSIVNPDDIHNSEKAPPTSTNQNVVELEASLFAHKQKIESLENLTQELEQTISVFKEKLNNVETENTLLKSTVDNLNTTISNQKENLQSAKDDIISYNHVIQELQIKLTQKEVLSKLDINDSVLEKMIANEHQVIANNENIVNIIHGFKNALDIRNKEIAELKNKANVALDNKDLLDELQMKTEDINRINLEVEDLKKQINENITLINKLVQEKANDKIIEQELSAKLIDIENKNSELNKINNDNTLCIEQLKAEIDYRTSELSEQNNNLTKLVEEMTKQITHLESSCNEKDGLISSLTKDKAESEENIVKAKTAVLKTQAIISTLSGNMQEYPEIINNVVSIFSALSDNLSTLETAALDIVTEKEETDKIHNNLKAQLQNIQTKHNADVKALTEQIENLSKSENIYKQENIALNETIKNLNDKLNKIQEDLDIKKTFNNTLEAKLNEATEMRHLEMSVSKTKQEQLEQVILEKDKTITSLTDRLNEIENMLKEKITEIDSFEKNLNETREIQHNLVTKIYHKITDITSGFETELHSTADLTNSMVTCEQILINLDKIGHHITFINLKNVDDDNTKMNEILTEAKKEIAELTNKNLSLEEKISEIEKTNSELMFEIEQNQDNNTKLNIDLKGSQEVLQDIQEELKMKASELALMEGKVKDWKKQFEDLDDIMKQQMSELKTENDNLKSRIAELKRESELSVVVYDNKDDYVDEVQDVTISAKISDLTTNTDTISPPSLQTICCNRIVDILEPKDSESKTTTNSSNDVENRTEIGICKCEYLQSELEAAREENSRIIAILAQMEMINQHLLEEQDLVRSEIQLLVEPAQELQKKITNHRTNLSILTATTYAENKSLKSQVKVLQHHHKRFHNVCQRDIPDFKKQLSSLMSILKGDPNTYDQQNVSFKRYSLPDVLDSSTTLPNFKNESTLDGDLLMLDTNVTLTTTADNTLMGNDQTCLDMTQYYAEASCQTNDLNQTIEQNASEKHIFVELSILKDENTKLRGLVEKYSNTKKSFTVDAQNSPIKNGNEQWNNSSAFVCENCKDLVQLKDAHDKLNIELNTLVDNLKLVMSQKNEIEQKYNSLILETPSTDALIKKLSIFEKEYNSQKQEISKLNSIITNKNKELKILQEENDSLSNQLMENISEADGLNKDLDTLKQENVHLEEKCRQLEQSSKEFALVTKADDTNCSQCAIKDELILSMQSKTNTHAKLNRSLSDSDTSSRYNKICTLQSELHAGREDCKELTEDVVTIKNHLERSDLSMDLDESMTEVNNYVFVKDFELSSAQSNRCNMPDIPEEHTKDIYVMDKTDCFNFYIERTGAQRDSLNHDTKIIEVMKMLCESLITKHNNEVENLTNKMKDYEEAKSRLQSQYYSVIEKHSQVSKELEDKDKKYANVANTLSQIRNKIMVINENVNNSTGADKTTIVNIFKESLMLLDREFDLVSAQIFESLIDNIVNKHQTDLSDIMHKYTKLQEHMETVTTELSSVSNNLQEIKSQLLAKENEYNLLQAQKERVHEISNAVTLDIVKREKELKDTIDNGYKKLIEFSVVKPEQVDSNLPLNKNINVLFELLVTQNSHRDKENEKETLLLEINSLKTMVEERQKEIDFIKTQHTAVTNILNDKDNKLRELTTSFEGLNKAYENSSKESKVHVALIEELTKELNMLKAKIIDKENHIQRLEQEIFVLRQNNDEIAKMAQVIESVKDLQDENAKLKCLNEMINKEKDAYAEELKKSGETIKKNNIDLDKMTSDILVLRESVKENSTVIENLSAEAKSLLKQNMELKEQLENKYRECSRLETNIKTHEKTAQIQTRMITRLEKQKADEEKILSETKQQLEELSQKYMSLQKESETSKAEAEPLRKAKSDLEARVAELEAMLETYKGRATLDVIADSSRRRRQSLHDSQRTFAEDKHDIGDHNGVEAIFDARPKPDDLFMDVDEDRSNRSTPIRISKGRDSLSLSRTDQSDKDDEHPSRPSSVLETRRRRQTIHDSHRSELSHTPSPHGDNESTISQLRKRLTACTQELEELKEKYKELDEECETCAEYLKERDAQCARLKKEKLSLETTITELREKLQTCNPNVSQMNASKPQVAHASVNTDEDWTNLHSLVVDRMSYNAEVEKNKKLTKTIEELRFKKQDLKNTLTKMQKALEKNSNRELEATRQELQQCKEQLSQLQDKYKELDEECEICGQYLREKEEQCRRLKEAKTALEAKLQELQSEANPALSARRKRRSAHDLNRAAAPNVADASTETSDDFLSYQVERDGNSRSSADEKHAKEVKHLKLAVERLSAQKAALEQQLSALAPAPHVYVATGSAIVQNQQITDVMKENQKLKKINAKLIHICRKRGKDSNRENEDPADQG